MRDDHHRLDLVTLQALEGDAPLDEIFEVLSNRQSRFALYYLGDAGTASLDEVAAAVTGFEAQASDAIASPDDEQGVKTRLYHLVLPKLDAQGFVEFDADERTVTLTGLPGPLANDEIEG